MRTAILRTCCAWLALTAGCAPLTRQPDSTASIELPAQWTQAELPSPSPSVPTPAVDWWQALHVAEIDGLVDRALRRNNDLAAAAIKVRQAQLTLALAQDNRTPQFSAGATSSASRDVEHGGTATHAYGVSASASYEVDLWGKLDSLRNEAEWEAQATEQDRAATALALVGTTIDAWGQIAYLNERLAASRASVAYAAQTLQLVRAQERAGGVSMLEVLTAEQNVATQQSSELDLQQQRIEAQTALALLFDHAPEIPDADPRNLDALVLPTIAPGLPASLLSRRPDLRAAELRLREDLAAVDATRASYYPSFTLTGSLGGSSTALADVVRNPLAALSSALSLPFLNRTQMNAHVGVSQATYDRDAVNFRQTLYAALGEVENALSSYRKLADEGALLESSLQAAQGAEHLYEVRYRAGKVALQAWLDAQESRRAAQNALAGNRLSRLKSYVSLCQALGGNAAVPGVPPVAAAAQVGSRLLSGKVD